MAASMNDVANGLRPQSPLEAPQGPGQGHARAPTRDVQRRGGDVHATRRGPWRSVRTDCDLRRDVGVSGLSRSRSHFAHVRIVAFEKTSVKHNTRCLLSFVDRVPVKRTLLSPHNKAERPKSCQLVSKTRVTSGSWVLTRCRFPAIRKTEVDPESRIFRAIRPTQLDFGIRATPRIDFGRFRTDRIGFGVILPIRRGIFWVWGCC